MSRIKSVDIIRLLAITAVITGHTQLCITPGNTIVWKCLSVLINQTARFSVAFFFVISGYFWGRKIRNGVPIVDSSRTMAKRIIIVFIAWSIIYIPPYNLLLRSLENYGLLGPVKVIYGNLIYQINDPVTLLMQGTKVHLWFLIALLCSLGISSFFVNRKYYKSLIALSVSLYFMGLLAGSYSQTPLGIDIHFNTRNGPFFGTILFVSGYFLSNLKPNLKWFQKGIALFGFGWFLHFSELYILWSLYGISPYREYVIGTYFMGLGAALASLSDHRILKNDKLSDIGKLTLGIYAIHFIFIDMFRPIGKLINTPLWWLGYVLIVLMFSVASVMLLSKNKVLRKIVV